ncbi:MAG: hypothetical protein Q4A54_06975 [Parabacteroides sp.]|nr:hypothetical protein [Parabacteroides sp.]
MTITSDNYHAVAITRLPMIVNYMCFVEIKKAINIATMQDVVNCLCLIKIYYTPQGVIVVV